MFYKYNFEFHLQLSQCNFIIVKRGKATYTAMTAGFAK